MSSEKVAVDVAAQVRAELSELADVLDYLQPEDWDRDSLCEGWRVAEVVAHVTMPANRSVPNVFCQLLRSRFRFNAMADRLARKDAERPVSELIAALRSERLQGWLPPGGGAEGALVHAVSTPWTSQNPSASAAVYLRNGRGRPGALSCGASTSSPSGPAFLVLADR